jgi:hypothetical protein
MITWCENQGLRTAPGVGISEGREWNMRVMPEGFGHKSAACIARMIIPRNIGDKMAMIKPVNS